MHAHRVEQNAFLVKCVYPLHLGEGTHVWHGFMLAPRGACMGGKQCMACTQNGARLQLASLVESGSSDSQELRGKRCPPHIERGIFHFLLRASAIWRLEEGTMTRICVHTSHTF